MHWQRNKYMTSLNKQVAEDHFCVKEAPRSLQESDLASNKAYVCLFTCTSTHAIHLKLTQGLNVQNFLFAFHRRGLLATIKSHNTKTFQSSSNKIQKMARSADHQITWSFITEKMPRWGLYLETRLQHKSHQSRKLLDRLLRVTTKCAPS